MTPQAKAKELVGKYSVWSNGNDATEYRYAAKQCALIAVDEVLQIRTLTGGWAKGIDLPINSSMTPYWQQVKQEINKL
jgi:hypothetical protein